MKLGPHVVALLALVVVLPAALRGDKAPYTAISAGAQTSAPGGSLQNVGQIAIGQAAGAALRMHAGIIPSLTRPASEGPCGDFDGDGDVDLDDFGSFAACYNGANNSPAPSCPAGLDADCDGDGDVDLDDFSIFAANYTGSL